MILALCAAISSLPRGRSLFAAAGVSLWLAACQTSAVLAPKKVTTTIVIPSASVPVRSPVPSAAIVAALHPIVPIALQSAPTLVVQVPAASAAALATDFHWPSPGPFASLAPGLATVVVRTVAGGVATDAAATQAVRPINGAGQQATFVLPMGLALRADGTLFVADMGQNLIRAIAAPDGAATVTTAAGTGASIQSSADLAAENAATPLKAHLVAPTALVFAPDGTLYFSESTGNRVRSLAPDGSVSGVSGYPAGNSGKGNWLGAGTPDGTYAAFHTPIGLALVSHTQKYQRGALCVCDQLNQRVRDIDIGNATHDTASLAGSDAAGLMDGLGEVAQFSFPSGLAADAQDNLYVQDGYNHRIRRVKPDGTVSTYAGAPTSVAGSDGRGLVDGPLASARFDFTGSRGPGLAFGPDGSLYVADTGNNRIRRIKDGMVTTLAGSGDPRDLPRYADGAGNVARFNAPQGLAVAADGTVYVADTGNARIRAIK
jgi:sugar lactone lactonase YvrE